MNAKEFVDSLFNGYEQTEALADFKEELLANLNAKIENFIRKGMDTDAAFARASAELGDVSSLADEMSLKKRKEVFEEVYMDIRMYMPAGRVAGYVVFGILAVFGITIALITLFAARSVEFMSGTSLDMTGFFGSMMPFLTAAIAGFTFLGVTQETASMRPVSKKRGAWYATAAGLISFGLFTMPIVYFGTRFAKDFVNDIIVNEIPVKNLETLVPVIGIIIPFVLPGAGLLTFLVLTEKDRLKPWAKNFHNKTAAGEIALWNDPVKAGRFGMFSGAIWLFAIGIFIALGFLIGFKFSWLVFIFAAAIQLVVQGRMYK
ncbi:MAG: permease prefix domain 1-containing protein [Treponema sp.]|jgi:hypothetical protein|nr:permease prefix domain 1-containing protein [Treponema sp.]